MTTPVIGDADGLGPAVDASTIVGADMTNNSIEEELRLTVAFNSILIYLRHHQTTALAWLGRRNDLFEDVSVEHPMVLWQLQL